MYPFFKSKHFIPQNPIWLTGNLGLHACMLAIWWLLCKRNLEKNKLLTRKIGANIIKFCTLKWLAIANCLFSLWLKLLTFLWSFSNQTSIHKVMAGLNSYSARCYKNWLNAFLRSCFLLNCLFGFQTKLAFF